MSVTKPAKGSLEKRAISGVGLRAEGQGDEMALVGYAASFNVLSQDLGGFREIIAPGAFASSLKGNADVKMLANHDPNKLLGRTKSGTLQVEEDSRGLKFRCKLDSTNSDHRNLYAAVKRGDMDECSFAFQVPDGGDEWQDRVDERGKPFVQRTLRNVKLMDVSAVTYPAYNAPGATQVDARKAAYSFNDPWAVQRTRLAKIDAAYESRNDESRRKKAAALGREIAAGRR